MLDVPDKMAGRGLFLSGFFAGGGYLNRENKLTEGAIGPALLRFAAPFLLASFLQALYGAVDLFVVGRFTGSAAVSAVAIGSQVMQTITGIILGVSMGGTVLIARRVGEKNDDGAARAVGTVAVLFCLLAAVLTPVMLLCVRPAIAIMETPPEAVADAMRYLFICACGIPFIIGYNGVSGVFRGTGDSKTPVYFIGLACAINIAMDFLLTGAFGMGAAGAATATVLAQGVSFLASLLYMKHRGLAFPIRREHIRLDFASVKRILVVGLPLALQDALVNVSFLIITAIINTMGVVASAAVGVVERIIGFAMLPPGAFASAVATVTAQNMGAGKPRRAYRGLWCGIGFSLIAGVAVCLYSQILPETLTGIFSRDPAVVTAAAQYLRAYSLDCILVSFVFCMNSYFSGCGKAVIAFAHSMVATFGVRIPVTYLMSRHAGSSLYDMGLAAPAATLLSLAICLIYLRWIGGRTQLRAQGEA